jgi:hypothetical protein
MSYIGASPTTAAFLTDTFSANGSGTVFTLSTAPANTNSILVAVSGVLQDPSTYSVSGTTLTFSAAPPAGTGNISVRFLGIPASGVTTTAYRTQTEFTATAGQTTFTPPSYTVGFIDVYRNGVLLGSADFTASNGTTVVLTNPATAGDLIETVSFLVSSVLNAIPATAGAVTSAYLLDASVTTAKIADANVTPAKLSQPLTLGTAVATTSGTSIDFTGIPSWVKRITIVLNGVSTNSSNTFLVQVGAGSVVTTGYKTITGRIFDSTPVATANTSAIAFWGVVSSSSEHFGNIVLTTVGSNIWVSSYSIGQGTSTLAAYGGGGVTLSGALDRVRLTTSGGDTFDAGSCNILYE